MTLATDPQHPHLGGNIIGGDPLSWTPNLWRHLLDTFSPPTVLDVGCGEGHALKWFRDAGVPSVGIDGLRANMERGVTTILLHDLTENAFVFRVGMVICTEVVQHIDEKYLEYLLMTLCNGDVIAMTTGEPGETWSWIYRIRARGYEALDPKPFREVAWLENEGSHFSRTGLIFRRTA